jgi:AcrR family transcriptional regulator
MPPETTPARPGLRERKKAKTRGSIQAHALRLFAKQGYHATTVEQIADAAEVSPSTFFRYFPTKEDVVLYDQFDPQLIEAFLAQPAELSAVAAVRRAMQFVFEHAPAAETALEFQRHELARSVPELRARMLDGFVSGLELFSDALAKRTGRRTDDIAVRTLAGAIIGTGLAAMLTGEGRPEEFFARFDAHLAQLETGLDL